MIDDWQEMDSATLGEDVLGRLCQRDAGRVSGSLESAEGDAATSAVGVVTSVATARQAHCRLTSARMSG